MWRVGVPHSLNFLAAVTREKQMTPDSRKAVTEGLRPVGATPLEWGRRPDCFCCSDGKNHTKCCGSHTAGTCRDGWRTDVKECLRLTRTHLCWHPSEEHSFVTVKQQLLSQPNTKHARPFSKGAGAVTADSDRDSAPEVADGRHRAFVAVSACELQREAGWWRRSVGCCHRHWKPCAPVGHGRGKTRQKSLCLRLQCRGSWPVSWGC